MSRSIDHSTGSTRTAAQARGVCFQVAHPDPQALIRHWERDPAFQVIQDTARAAQLAFIPVVDTDRDRLIITIGRARICLTERERVHIARDPCDDPSPATDALRIGLRVVIVASGYVTDEAAGLVLLAACSLREQEDIGYRDVAACVG